jgi:putative hydrolase of the HAD superfamily
MASDQGDSSGIRHVLFDADGVIQTIPGGWYAAMEPYVGGRAQEFLHGTWKDEKPMLAGQGEYLRLLAARLAEFGVSASVDQVYRDVWQRIDPDRASLAIVQALRANGYGVHLGTNQERHRAAHMPEHWELGQGHDVLLGLLASHGVAPVRPADDAA